MPAGSLDPVVQPVGADASAYKAEFLSVLPVLRQVSAAQQDIIRQAAEVGKAIQGMGGGAGSGGAESIAKVNAAIREQLQILGQHASTVSEVAAASASLGSVQEQIAAIVRDAGAAARETSAALTDLAVSQEKVRAVSVDGGSAIRAYASDVTALKSSVTEVRAAVDDASRSIDVLTAKASGAGPSTISILGPELASRLTGGGGGGDVGALLGGAGGGILGGLLGGGGGGGGGGGFGPGTAGGMFGQVAQFISRWAGPAHYALMGTMEALATIGPALTAAGAAALVGAQGGEQLQNRFQAIYATSESLGPSLNKTAGSFIGVGSALQQAQNMATGGVYELAGAGINIARSGAGGSLLQMGQNTMAMLDRAAASLTEQFQTGGLGGQLAGLVGGGTGYLQQFGAVGGNLGRLLLNVAPNLPGVGADYLSILQGGTKAAASATGFLGGGLAPVLAFEAAARLGTPLVGGLGALVESGGAGLARLGLGGTLGDVGLAGVSAGQFLGGLTTGDVGAAGALALLLGKGGTYQQPYVQQAGALQAALGQMYPGQALGGATIGTSGMSLIQAMNQAAGVPISAAPGPGGNANIVQGTRNWWDALTNLSPGGMWRGDTQAMHGLLQDVGIIGGDPNKSQVAQTQLQTMAEQYVNLADAGKQVQQVWDGLSHSSVGLGQAYALMTMAGYQVGDMFQKTGKNAGLLTPTAKTELQNLYAGYAPMMMNTGQFGAAVGAQTAMGGLAKSQLSSVNSAYDQLTQIVSGGPAGTAALSTLIAAMGPAGPTGKGATAQAGAAKALTSFTSPAGAAAWTSFASTSQASVLSQLESQFDWLRTAQTLGAIGPGAAGTAGMGAYYLKQALPYAKDSPAALAQLGSFAQQLGGPGYTPGESQAQAWKSISQWVNATAEKAPAFTKSMNDATINLSSIPRDAQQFVTTASSGVLPAMQQAIAQNAAATMTAFQDSITRKGFSAADLGKVGGVLTQQGAGLASQQAIIKFAAQMSGATPAQINAMMGQVKKDYDIEVKAHADVSEAQAQLNSVKAPPPVTIPVRADVSAAQSAIDAVHGTTVVINEVLRVTGGGSGGTVAGQVGLGVGRYMTTMQTGGLVPGSGFGDIVPAMLEPGEAIIPRYLVPMLAPLLARYRIPGFGGAPMGSSSHFAAGGLMPAGGGGTDDPRLAAAANGIAVQIINGITKAMSTAKLDSVAQSLVSQLSKEMSYAKSTGATALAGFNISGMDLTQGTTTGDMQTYLQGLQSFSKDIGSLGKAGLNKTLLQQLISAGPSSDPVAQDLLGMNSTGGNSVKLANSLFGQIQKASTGFGYTAAQAIYGGHLSAQGGTASTGPITVNINAPGGTTLSLSAAQIKQITELVQAALLKQAKRNNQTGVTLAGRRS